MLSDIVILLGVVPLHCIALSLPAPRLMALVTCLGPHVSNKRLLSSVHSPLNSRHTTVCCRMALQAPLWFIASVGKEQVTRVIWDSGASLSISNSKDDFVGDFKPAPIWVWLRGLAKGLKIEGEGHVLWAVMDNKGMLQMLKLPAYYVPKSPVRLLSTTSLLQTYSGETIFMEPHELTLSSLPSDPLRSPVVVRVDPTNNLPTSQIYHYEAPERAIEALANTLTVVSNDNINLSEPQKELLRWHYRLGHLSFRKIQFIM